MEPVMKIALAAPIRRHSLNDWHYACAMFKQHAESLGHVVFPANMTDMSLLEHGRSMIASTAIDEGADVVLWVDDDITFLPEDGMLLCEGAMEKKSLVSAAVSIKGAGALNVTFKPGQWVWFFKNGGLYEIETAGTGFEAVHRDCFNALEGELGRVEVAIGGPLVVPYFRCLITEGTDGIRRWHGEDTSFALKLGSMGFTLWADTRVRCQHWGLQPLRVEDVLKGRAREEGSMGPFQF